MADANSNPNGYTVESGLAQKGPLLQGSQITINELSTPNFQPTGRSFSMEVTNNAGKFNPNGIYFVSPYLSTTASGYYFNEISGQRSNDTVNLRGLSDLSAGGDAVINVNVLSTFAKNRTINLATGTNLLNPSTGAPYTTPPAKLPFANARAQAQAETLKAFYINNSASILSGRSLNGVSQPGSFTALDLNQNRAADQILAAISAMVMTAGQNGSGVNTLLSQIEADLADDGLLNNSPGYSTSVQSQMCAAAATTDFSVVASNLNKAYGTNYQGTDLSQWIDTSGCADQLSNKYKFIATNVAAGIESKSPPYIVGADDVAQCFSVSSAGDGTIAKLYVNGSAVANAQLVKLGDSLQIGITPASGNTNTAYIQRSVPISNGVCGNGSGIKVFKYTAATALSTYTVGGTVTGLASGQSMTLVNNGGNVKVVSGNGPFTFSTALTQGTNFSISIMSQPSGQTCNVSNGYGWIFSNVTNIAINCGSTSSQLISSTPLSGAYTGTSGNDVFNGTIPADYAYGNEISAVKNFQLIDNLGNAAIIANQTSASGGYTTYGINNSKITISSGTLTINSTDIGGYYARAIASTTVNSGNGQVDITASVSDSIAIIYGAIGIDSSNFNLGDGNNNIKALVKWDSRGFTLCGICGSRITLGNGANTVSATIRNINDMENPQWGVSGSTLIFGGGSNNVSINSAGGLNASSLTFGDGNNNLIITSSQTAIAISTIIMGDGNNVIKLLGQQSNQLSSQSAVINFGKGSNLLSVARGSVVATATGGQNVLEIFGGLSTQYTITKSEGKIVVKSNSDAFSIYTLSGFTSVKFMDRVISLTNF